MLLALTIGFDVYLCDCVQTSVEIFSNVNCDFSDVSSSSSAVIASVDAGNCTHLAQLQSNWPLSAEAMQLDAGCVGKLRLLFQEVLPFG